MVCWNVGAEGVALRWLCLGEVDASAFVLGGEKYKAWGMDEDEDGALNSVYCVSVYLCSCRVDAQIQ